MAFRTTSCCLLVLLCTCFLGAQGLPFQRIVLTKVAETPLNGITSIAEDERGFLWLGGVSGLYKYDGTSIDVFTNRPNDSSSIVSGPYTQILKAGKKKPCGSAAAPAESVFLIYGPNARVTMPLTQQIPAR
ncbi:MAG: hypothetical protein IPK76_02660 [Lewinellaceae bacterium]|nr:hypothetical protein [Lewinellaceae bacterium]